jgi:hypothetical protein
MDEVRQEMEQAGQVMAPVLEQARVVDQEQARFLASRFRVEKGMKVTAARMASLSLHRRRIK